MPTSEPSSLLYGGRISRSATLLTWAGSRCWLGITLLNAMLSSAGKRPGHKHDHQEAVWHPSPPMQSLLPMALPLIESFSLLF